MEGGKRESEAWKLSALLGIFNQRYVILITNYICVH